MIAETLDHDGLTIKIHYDEDCSAEFVRDHDGILGCFIGHHPDYNLFDGPHDIEARDGLPLAKPCDACEGEGYVAPDSKWASDREAYVIGMETDEKVCAKCDGNQELERTLEQFFREEYDSRIVLGLFLLDHSGLRIRTGSTNLMDGTDERAATRSSGRFIGDEAGWDTSFIGFVFDSAESRERTGCDWSAEKIRGSIESEVEEFDMYLSGQVYGYTLEHEGEQLPDSCWGFIGLKYVIEEAKLAAKCAAKAIDRERAEAHYWTERGVPTV